MRGSDEEGLPLGENCGKGPSALAEKRSAQGFPGTTAYFDERLTTINNSYSLRKSAQLLSKLEG